MGEGEEEERVREPAAIAARRKKKKSGGAFLRVQGEVWSRESKAVSSLRSSEESIKRRTRIHNLIQREREQGKGPSAFVRQSKKQRSAFKKKKREEGRGRKKKTRRRAVESSSTTTTHAATSHAFAPQCAGFLASFSRFDHPCVDTATRCHPLMSKEERKRELKGNKT